MMLKSRYHMRMNNDQSLRGNAVFFQNLYRILSRLPVPKMTCDRKPRRQVCLRCRFDKLSIRLIKPARIGSDLNKTGPNSSIAYTILKFIYPDFSYLIGGHFFNRTMQIFVIHRTVITGISYNLKTALISKPLE